MSFMKADLLTKSRKLVKGLAIAELVWLKAMKQAPPATFPHPCEIERISLPEDTYIKKFFKKHQEIAAFEPVPGRIFGLWVFNLKEQGVGEQEAMAIADMEYRQEKKAKKKAYKRLKEVARLQGKKLPPNPFPSPIKEIQAEEVKFVQDRFFNPKIRQIVENMKEERARELRERANGGGW